MLVRLGIAVLLNDIDAIRHPWTIGKDDRENLKTLIKKFTTELKKETD